MQVLYYNKGSGRYCPYYTPKPQEFQVHFVFSAALWQFLCLFLRYYIDFFLIHAIILT